jgi:hypothetical protein
MTNPRLSRGTKLPAPSKNEIVKRESERPKKMIKDKTLLNPRPPRRDPEDVETESKPQRSVVGSVPLITSAPSVTFALTSFVISASLIISASSIISASWVISAPSAISVTSIDLVADPIFDGMNRDVLIRLLTTLISSSAESSNVFVVDIVVDSSSARTSAFVIESVVITAEASTTLDEFSDFDEFLARKEKRRNFLKKMKSHEQRRVIDFSSVFVSSSTRDLLFSVTRVTTSFRNVVALSSRISKTSRRRNVVETKSDELSIDRLVVEKKNDDELIDENDDEFSNCIKCCRVSMSCRRVIDIACARCSRQKQVCISICLRFAFFEEFLLIMLDFCSI